jgi:serine/threonine protein kinase
VSNEKRRHNALPDGYKLHWYEIHAILGRGGFGITYLALDTNLNHEVAIKEFLPTDLAMRASDSSIHPISDDQTDTFGWGLNRFITEAQTLAQFRHPNIVLVHSVFEANGTAYMVMEYEKGESLEEAYNLNRLTTEEDLLSLLHPLMDGLERIHQSGFVHRDIKPKNIYLRDDGRPVLLDFGSARQALGVETRTLTTLVSPGYAPFEQYNATRESDKQGPWTDIYAMGATIYRGMSGKSPVDALARANAKLEGTKDILEPAVELGKDKFSVQFLEAIDLALRFSPDERPQSIAAWRDLLPEWEDAATVLTPGGATIRGPRPGQTDRDAATQVSPDTLPDNHFTNEGTLIVGSGAHLPGVGAAAKSSSKSGVAIVAVVVAVIGIAIGVWQMQTRSTAAPEKEPATTSTAQASNSSEASSATAGAGQTSSIPKPSLNEVTAFLGTMPCSVLQASINDRTLAVRGFAAGEKVMARIDGSLGNIAGISELKNEIRALPRAFCQTLEFYAPYWKANRDAGFGTVIGTQNSDDTFVGGERLVLDINTPTYNSWLHVDYFDHEGNVVHMMPSPGEEFNQGEPRAFFQLGEEGDIGLWEVAPPFGTDMIVLLAASVPLFEGARGQFEDANDYRAALGKRLKTLAAESPGAKVSAAFVVVTTKDGS